MLFANEETTKKTNSSDEMEMEGKGRSPKAIRDLTQRQHFASTLSMPEWMVEIPEDLATEWLVKPRPEGRRYILSARNGKTYIRSMNGYSKLVDSNLPGSAYVCSLHFTSRRSKRGNCVLDVIISEDHIVYVMDIIYFNNINYDDAEAETRFFTISCRVGNEIKSIVRKVIFIIHV